MLNRHQRATPRPSHSCRALGSCSSWAHLPTQPTRCPQKVTQFLRPHATLLPVLPILVHKDSEQCPPTPYHATYGLKTLGLLSRRNESQMTSYRLHQRRSRRYCQMPSQYLAKIKILSGGFQYVSRYDTDKLLRNVCMRRWNEKQPGGQGLEVDFDIYFKSLSREEIQVRFHTYVSSI